jgi:DNA-binding response OmpR family regulator
MTAVSGADRKTILFVEDDTHFAAAITAALADDGYVIDRVAGGRAALACLLRWHPDLLLLDLGLPDIDGLEICRLARRRAPDLPIIALTAHTGIRDVVAGFAEGADDYIRKPVDLDVLLARIGAVLRARDRQGGSDASPARGAQRTP